MITNSENWRCKVVSFSGIDGAGKSTQIINLQANMKAFGLRVQLITFWDDIARFTRIREITGQTLFQGDKGVGTPAAPINRRDKNVRSWLMTLIRLGIYFVDAVSLRIALKKALRSDVDFVIFDRYIYDELANLTLHNSVIRIYARFIMKVTPRPDISYLLDSDPVQARARKPEYPIEFLYFCRASYLTLSDLVPGGMTVIPPMPLQDVGRLVLQYSQNLFSAEGIQREQTTNSLG
jgi:thymidylate kinase